MDRVRNKSPAYLSALQPGPPVWKSWFKRRPAGAVKTPFQYTSLNPNTSEIRLLTLLPRSQTENGTLACHVEHVFLDDNQPYAALSYVWGNPASTVPIVLNGQSHAITENLSVALRHLQHGHKRLKLWVDSICINQQDNDEKASQVQRMGRIYSEAAVVLSWLGPSDHQSNITMMKLRKLGKWWNDTFSSFPSCSDPTAMAASLNALLPKVLPRLKAGLGPDADVPYPLITKLLSRPYWHRLWIQQELSLGRETIFVCGDEDLDKGVLQDAIDAAINLAARCSDGWGVDLKAASDTLLDETGPSILMFYSSNSDSLRELLYRSTFPRRAGSFKAFDRRDMVYGLLSISNDANILQIQPDYSKLWQDVYREVTEAYIKQGDLEILSFAGLSPIQTGLPSWVPDWSQSLSSTPISRHGRLPSTTDAISVPFYSAATSYHCRFLFPQPGMVSLSGCHFDVVSKTSRQFSAHQHPDEQYDTNQIYVLFQKDSLDDLWINREPRTSPYGDGQLADWVIAMLCAFVAGTQSTDYQDQRGRGPLRWIPGCDFDRMARTMANNSEEFDEDVSQSYINTVEKFDKLPFVTAKGYVGTGPPQLVPGDEICICYGASVPFAIRRSREGQTYELLGDVYVHGIMYGEFAASMPETRMFTFS
jgi:hypothetical protein